MAEAGVDQGSPAAGEAGVLPPGDPKLRDWAGGLPPEVLARVAETLVAQTEAGWAAWLKEVGWSEEEVEEKMGRRKRDGNCLFVFALVCKEWRKAQIKVGGRLRTRALSDVILPGQVALAKWALAEGCPRWRGYPQDPNMARAAARHGHLELIKWLCGEGGFAMDRTVMALSARSGNLELVRWLRGEGCDWSADTCMCAAEAGRTGVLQWLRANGCPWDAETCKFAAFNGHLETLRWARENGCHWSPRTCSQASEGGHLEILQWLRAEGCPWNFITCHWAVDRGHVEVLRWARANGCLWRAATRDEAAQKLGYTDDFGNLG